MKITISWEINLGEYDYLIDGLLVIVKLFRLISTIDQLHDDRGIAQFVPQGDRSEK
jgi:hypothetical protein